MLHDIAVGPVAEQPAGKDAAPLIVRAAAHVELNESAGFRDIFPRRGGLAGLQADDCIAHAQRFARLHGQVAGQAVALVEQADDGGALGHGGAGHHVVAGGANRRSFNLHRAGLICGRQLIVATCRQRQRQRAG